MENKITTPKQVSDFAKEYERLYIALGQAENIIAILRKEIAEYKEKTK